jgi:hypothetical protein
MAKDDDRRRNAALSLILGAMIVLTAFLALRPLRLEAPIFGSARTLLNLDNAVGATVEPVDRATATTLGLSSPAGDLVVTSVANRGPAAAAGIRVGDVIERIGGKPAAASAAPRAPTVVMINRGGKRAMLRIAFTTGPNR